MQRLGDDADADAVGDSLGASTGADAYADADADADCGMSNIMRQNTSRVLYIWGNFV
jgi:hypothetical protein